MTTVCVSAHQVPCKKKSAVKGQNLLSIFVISFISLS